MKFTTRIILITGLSTLLLTSLYWAVGWQLVERIEAANREAVAAWLARQPELAQLDLTPLLDEPEASEALETLLVVFGVLLFSLSTMGLTLWLLWQQTRPVRTLMQAIQAVDPQAPHLDPLPRDDELGEMSRRFAQLLKRIQGFVERERNFTRFASHELRSPLMSMRSSLALLQEVPQDRTAPAQRALERLERALQRMEQLTDSFLWLSREQGADSRLIDEPQLRQLLARQQEQGAPCDALQIRIEPPLQWSIHPFVLSVILDNLLGNARQHGTGPVQLKADRHSLTLDNRIAPADDYQGFGYGLPIIHQLCDKAGARFQHRQEDDRFIARIEFQPPLPAARAATSAS